MATWTERIDNIQGRLADLVSEEFAGANFYNTDITVSDYNPTIDSTVTLTITLTNAEGDPVESANVTVTASEGNFTKYNGSTITGASSYTGTTNSNGQFTLTYTCSEWGLVTFSANNKTSIQCKVTGFKNVHSGASNRIKVYTDGTMVYFTMQGSFTMNANADTNIGAIPLDYAPNEMISVPAHYGSTNKLLIQTNGNLLYHNNTSTTSQTLRIGVVYPLKAALP